jgi:hypothetical protein
MKMTREEQILASFDHHRPTEDQTARIETIRGVFKNTAWECFRSCPDSADRTAALRLLHEAMMTANKSIACENDK